MAWLPFQKPSILKFFPKWLILILIFINVIVCPFFNGRTLGLLIGQRMSPRSKKPSFFGFQMNSYFRVSVIKIVNCAYLYSGDLNTGKSLIQMVKSCLIIEWSGIWMPVQYHAKFSPVFKWWSEYQTTI